MSSTDNNSDDNKKKQPHKKNTQDGVEKSEKEENEDKETEGKEQMEIQSGTIMEIEKKIISAMVRNKKVIPERLLKKVMLHNDIPNDAVALDVDLRNPTGSELWMCPPSFWTGEAMKTTKLAKLLFESNQFYGLTIIPKFLSEKQAGKPGEKNKNIIHV